MSKTIFCFGYGPVDKGVPPELTPTEFDFIVKSINPGLLLDCRRYPTGSRIAGFGNKQIEARHPNIYQWRGDELGGIKAENTTQAGLDRLVADAQTQRIAAFCACGMPYFEQGTCHLVGLIATKIYQDVTVKHIFKGTPGGALITVEFTELQRWLKGGRHGEYKFEEWPS
jgi:hypothetical protein